MLILDRKSSTALNFPGHLEVKRKALWDNIAHVKWLTWPENIIMYSILRVLKAFFKGYLKITPTDLSLKWISHDHIRRQAVFEPYEHILCKYNTKTKAGEGMNQILGRKKWRAMFQICSPCNMDYFVHVIAKAINVTVCPGIYVSDNKHSSWNWK